MVAAADKSRPSKNGVRRNALSDGLTGLI